MFFTTSSFWVYTDMELFVFLRIVRPVLFRCVFFEGYGKKRLSTFFFAEKLL